MSFKPADDAKLKEQLQQVFLQKSFEEWQAVFAQVDACVEPVLKFEETVTHPLFVEREMYVDVAKPDGTAQKQMACPIKSNVFKPTYTAVGVKAGTHNEEILGAPIN